MIPVRLVKSVYVKYGERTNEWMNEQMDGWMDGCLDEWMDIICERPPY